MSETFTLKLTSNSLEVMPGQEVQAIVQVENTGHILDVYIIQVSGVDPTWSRLSERTFPVYPGETTAVTIIFQPPEVSDTVARDYRFTVDVTSQNFPLERAFLCGDLIVRPVFSFFHDLHPTRETLNNWLNMAY